MPSSQQPGTVHLPPKWSNPRVVLIPQYPKVLFPLDRCWSSHSHRSDRVSSNGGHPFFSSNPKVTFQFGFDHGGPFQLIPKSFVARFPSVVGPFPVLLPEGCSPGSVSARGFQAEAFPPSRSLQQRLSRRTVTVTPPGSCTVIGNSTTSCGPPDTTFLERHVADSSPKFRIILRAVGTFGTRKF